MLASYSVINGVSFIGSEPAHSPPSERLEPHHHFPICRPVVHRNNIALLILENCGRLIGLTVRKQKQKSLSLLFCLSNI